MAMSTNYEVDELREEVDFKFANAESILQEYVHKINEANENILIK